MACSLPRSYSGEAGIALLAGLQGQDRERRPRVRDVMSAVAVERAREPAARLALVGLQPGDPAPEGLLGGRDPGLAEDVQDQPGRVAVAEGVLVLRLAVQALPGAQRGQAPAAVLALEGQQRLDRALALGLVHQAV